MRFLMIAAAAAACGACDRGPAGNIADPEVGNSGKAGIATTGQKQPVPPAETNATASAVAPATGAASMPSGFPSSDPIELAANCVVYIGLSRDDRANAVGHDDAAMTQAQDQARAALQLALSNDGANQLIASSVNPLSSTPAAQRDAASRYCVENAPEPDPDAH